MIHSIDTMRDQEHRRALAGAHPISSAALHSVKPDMSVEEMQAKLGEPYSKFIRTTRRGQEIGVCRYTDGESDLTGRHI